MSRSTKIFMTLLLCAFVFCGSVPESFAYSYHRSLGKAVELMLSGDYDKAIKECQMVRSYMRADVVPQSQQIEATCLVEQGDFGEARELYKKVTAQAKGKLLMEAYLGIADTYFLQERYDEAIVVYEQLMSKTSENADFMAQLYYKSGKTYQRVSKWTKADYYFKFLTTKFPDSLEAKLAGDSSVDGNYFTVQVGCFANKGNADQLNQDLTSKGYEAYVTEFESRGRKFYRVRVGKFVSFKAAEFEEQKLSSNEHLPTHIFP